MSINLRSIGDKNDRLEGIHDNDGFYDGGVGGDKRDNSKRTDEIYERSSGRSNYEKRKYNEEIESEEREKVTLNREAGGNMRYSDDPESDMPTGDYWEWSCKCAEQKAST